MRITNQLFFNNTNYNYQSTMNDLYKANTQLSTGLKISNSYDDSGVYVDAMRLNYEITTLEQVKESSSKAQTFANNTDKAMNQFSESLDQFKVKLTQAANSSQSITSREAIANELEAELEYLKSVANTSINGTYIFSGSATSTKPIAADGSYQGNGESIKATVGAGVQLAYNIDGKSLFTGSDSDYSRIVTTNVSMFNQTELHPDIMNAGYVGKDIAKEVYINESDTIRDLVGDTDSDKTNDPDSVFYVRGKNSSGVAIDTKIQMTSDAKVSDLLEKIGIAYGNTADNKLVDVTFNNSGQIEVKDLQTGSSALEFHMFGAVDRNETGGAGNAGNADVSDIDDLLTNPNVDIIEFIKSDFDQLTTASNVLSRERVFSPGTFDVGFAMTDDGSPVKTTTLLRSFMGSTLDEIDLAGTDDTGAAVTATLTVGATTTVQDLLTEIETQYGNVTASLVNGQIVVVDNSLGTNPTFGTSNLGISLTSQDGGVDIPSFSVADSMNFERIGFELDGNELLGNISQIINATGEYAVAKDKLIDAAGISSLAGTVLTLQVTDVLGNERSAQINLDGTQSTFDIDLNGDGAFAANENFVIFNATGGDTKADEMTYQQLMDVVGMMISNTFPTDADLPTDGIQFDEYNLANINARNAVEVSLDDRGRLQIIDRNNSVSSMRLSMHDSNADTVGTPSALSFMANDALTIDDPSINFFADMQKMIDAVKNGDYRANGEGGDKRSTGIQGALKRIDHIIDHFTKKHTKIGALSNALQSAGERAQLLSINVQTVKSEIVDADIAETTLKFQQLSIQYQAMLSSISRINSLSLVNYM